MAKKILFYDKTATSVLASSDGVEYVLSATKEIVLSAGAVSYLSCHWYTFDVILTLRSSNHLSC